MLAPTPRSLPRAQACHNTREKDFTVFRPTCTLVPRLAFIFLVPSCMRQPSSQRVVRNMWRNLQRNLWLLASARCMSSAPPSGSKLSRAFSLGLFVECAACSRAIHSPGVCSSRFVIVAVLVSQRTFLPTHPSAPSERYRLIANTSEQGSWRRTSCHPLDVSVHGFLRCDPVHRHVRVEPSTYSLNPLAPFISTISIAGLAIEFAALVSGPSHCSHEPGIQDGVSVPDVFSPCPPQSRIYRAPGRCSYPILSRSLSLFLSLSLSEPPHGEAAASAAASAAATG